MLKITNTLTQHKEIFTPIQPHHAAMYVCGVTPYDYSHLGHGRVYVTFDVLYRLLKKLGYQTTYVRNYTDIDDKILNRAHKELGDQMQFEQIAQRYITAYQEDMAKLNCLTPDHEPRVTGTIPEIIAFIQKLIDNGNAYQVGNDVYFSVASFAPYGQLSKRTHDDLVGGEGERVDVNDKKRSPLDFALWKGNEENLFWKSPWGYGRPGWHIECSAMALAYLGKHIDIHGGGLDLIFPHHENEIAQSQSLPDNPFVKYWMHNAFVKINNEKMSKSLGNFFTLRDIFEHFDPMFVRYYYLSHHYRSPLEFTMEDLKGAEKAYRKLTRVFDAVRTLQGDGMADSPVVSRMQEFLCDDLNTPGMFGVLFENLSHLQKNEQEARAVYVFLRDTLGLTLEPLPEKQVEMTPEIEQLIADREAARARKDWAAADALRAKLQELGIDVQDRKL